MKVEFDVSKEKLQDMIWAINDLLDYYQCGSSDYPFDPEYAKQLEEDGLDLACAAYELGSTLQEILYTNEENK